LWEIPHLGDSHLCECKVLRRIGEHGMSQINQVAELPALGLKHGNNHVYGGDINAYGLTNRETEVLILLARGYTRKEIGATLNITQNTAATHVASLYRKLDVGSIAEATHIAIRCALVRLM